jgi:RNA polymerase sigma-70 factor (ECF subfamily)
MVEPAPDADDTRRLLDRAAAGDPTAFGELLDQYRDFLRLVVRLRMHPRLRARVDPSDVVQEAQLDALRRLPDYLDRRPMPFRLWLRKTVQERLLKVHRWHLEAGRRTAEREVPLPDESSLLLATRLLARGSAPDRRLDRSETVRLVRRAVAGLPEADREVLLMRNFEGLSNQEVAYLLGLDAATASKRHGRALLRLRQVLLAGGFTGSQP